MQTYINCIVVLVILATLNSNKEHSVSMFSKKKTKKIKLKKKSRFPSPYHSFCVYIWLWPEHSVGSTILPFPFPFPVPSTICAAILTNVCVSEWVSKHCWTHAVGMRRLLPHKTGHRTKQSHIECSREVLLLLLLWTDDGLLSVSRADLLFFVSVPHHKKNKCSEHPFSSNRI